MEVQLRRTYLPKLFGKSGWVPNRSSESGQEGSKESRSAISLAPRSTAETPLAIFQTVSEGKFCEVGLPFYGVLRSSPRPSSTQATANITLLGEVSPIARRV